MAVRASLRSGYLLTPRNLSCQGRLTYIKVRTLRGPHVASSTLLERSLLLMLGLVLHCVAVFTPLRVFGLWEEEPGLPPLRTGPMLQAER